MEELNGIDQNYLEQISELKSKMESMVPGDEYTRVLEEHKRLTEEYINKRQPVQKQEVFASAQDLSKKLASGKLNKVEHVKASLEYRDAVRREHGKDVWVGAGITEQEAEQVAEHYKTLLEEYGDNPSEFTYRFDSTIVDDPQVLVAIKAKKNKK